MSSQQVTFQQAIAQMPKEVYERLKTAVELRQMAGWQAPHRGEQKATSCRP